MAKISPLMLVPPLIMAFAVGAAAVAVTAAGDFDAGSKTFVLDGHSCSQLIVVARSDGRERYPIGFEGGADGTGEVNDFADVFAVVDS